MQHAQRAAPLYQRAAQPTEAETPADLEARLTPALLPAPTHLVHHRRASPGPSCCAVPWLHVAMHELLNEPWCRHAAMQNESKQKETRQDKTSTHLVHHRRLPRRLHLAVGRDVVADRGAHRPARVLALHRGGCRSSGAWGLGRDPAAGNAPALACTAQRRLQSSPPAASTPPCAACARLCPCLRPASRSAPPPDPPSGACSWCSSPLPGNAWLPCHTWCGRWQSRAAAARGAGRGAGGRRGGRWRRRRHTTGSAALPQLYVCLVGRAGRCVGRRPCTGGVTRT